MKSIRQSFLWLTIGAALMLFSNGRWIIPFATWIYPVFFLRFMRLQKPLKRFMLLALVVAVVDMIIWWKMIPLPIGFYLILTGFIFQIFTLSYLADRFIATHIKGFSSTLVFPFAYCTIEYFLATFTSKGTWCSIAYTQADNLLLNQLVSITGIWGIIFLITWFASVINWAWEQNFEWKKIRKGSMIFTSAAAVVLLFGVVRLNFFSHLNGTVRTASIVQARNENKELSTCKWTDAKAIGNYSADVENNLLEKTQQAANAGAKIILWQEAASWLSREEERNFIARAMKLAAQEKIYLLMTLWSVPEDYPKHLVENKLILINPDGTQQLTYIKNNPAPPEPIVKGDGVIPAIQTVYGKIAPAICADADYPGFIRQAGKKNVGIMFIPANDWKAIDPIHTNMTITRAIENGFSLVHPAGQGLSVATDNRGRIISSMDFFNTDEQVMYADVPVQHSFTVYAQVGDVFAWLCIAGFLLTIISVILKKYFTGIKGLYKKQVHQNMKTSLD